LFFGKNYYWRVRARNLVDTTSWSTQWTFNTNDYVTLSSPAEAQLNVARIKDLEAKAALNSARAAAISDSENSDETIAMNHAKDVASRSVPTTPAIPPEGSERETEALNAANTVKDFLASKRSTTGTSTPGKGGTGKGSTPVRRSTTGTSTSGKGGTGKGSTPVRRSTTGTSTSGGGSNKNRRSGGGSNKNRRSGGGSTTGTSTSGGGSNKNRRSVGEGLMPEHAMIAAQIRRENLMRKRNENHPDERY
jgi:hypothetical protein